MKSIPKKIQLFLAGALTRPKPSKDHVGQVGEEAIARYVKQLGWKILARNWRPSGAYHGLELDIIAKKEDTLIFIEVKTRTFSQVQQEKTSHTDSVQKSAENNVKSKQDTSHAIKISPVQTENHKEKVALEGEYIPAYASFTKKKQQHVLQAAKHYLASNDLWESPCQFDLFCVQENSNGEFGIEHYEHVIEIGQTLDSRNSHWEPW